MDFLRLVRDRIRALFRNRTVEKDMDAELRLHMDLLIEEYEQSGMTRQDAQRAARRRFGNPAYISERSRDVRGAGLPGDLIRDLSYAWRTCRRTPAFTAAVILILALGIGANTLIFSLVNEVLLRSLPYPNADRLAVIWFTPQNKTAQKFGTNSGAYFILRDNNHVFETMGAGRLNQFFNVSAELDGASREYVQAQWFSPDMMRVLAVQPLLGRWPDADDSARDTADGGFHITISHGLWQRMFGGSPDVLGMKLRIDSGVATIVGVMPQGFQLLNPDTELWVRQPDQNLRNALRSPNRIFTLVGRLKPGVSLEAAQAEMSALASRVSEELPETHSGWTTRVESLQDAYVANIRKPLLIFQGAVCFLLLIACANVASLLLARAATRQKELAVRAAIGSNRGRIVRQLLAENLLLAIMGGLLGVALAWAGIKMLASMTLAGLPRLGEVSMDMHVLAFAAVVSLCSCFIFGAVPALQISHPDLMELLRDSSRSVTGGLTRQRLRSAFVVVQISLSLVLLIASGLMIRSILRLNTAQIGFDPHGLITLQIPFSRSFYRSVPGTNNTPAGGLLIEFDARFSQLGEKIRERLESVPSVHSATSTMTPPLGGTPRRINFSREGQVIAPSEREVWSAEWYPVSAGYFTTLNIPMLQGREIEERDAYATRPVVVINRTMAQRFWPNEDPVGKLVQLSVLDDQPREIIGVAGDVRQNRYDHDPQPQMYVPRDQLRRRMDMTVGLEVLVTTFVIRTGNDPSQMASVLRAAVRDVDRNQPISSIRTVQEYAAGQLQELRQYAILLTIFGGIAAALAIIGLFGIMAHAVSQRTNEIGIRMALGADSRGIIALVLRQGMLVIFIGVIIGIATSLMLTRVIQSFLWGITATDPLTFIVVAAGLAAVALLASYLPARRALHVDPVIALRAD